MTKPIIVLHDAGTLRLSDLPALHHAAQQGAPVIPVFIFDDEAPVREALGGAARWWLHHSLIDLSASYASLGSSLIMRRGAPPRALADLIAETGAGSVHITRAYEPRLRALEDDYQAVAAVEGATIRRFSGRLMHEPEEIKTQAGKPYTVFSPFWKACLKAAHPGAPLPAPSNLAGPEGNKDQTPDSLTVEDLQLLPTIPWDQGFYDHWTPGRDGAIERMTAFVKARLNDYHDSRNIPSDQGTSGLSPHLRFGELSVRELRFHIETTVGDSDRRGSGAEHFIRELGWREFSNHLLYHFPSLPEAPLREQFAHFPWESGDSDWLRAWQRGQTGFPIVDAGMRQLWQTGWMHNRVRMIVASLLVKELLWHWQDGMDWFWDTLVDGDLAANTASWQWAAGCGADAAPYFRIFNPILQGEKFDPEGTYVRTYVPELRHMPDAFIHKPFEAPALVLQAASVTLGKTYPKPLVDRSEARARALAALDASKAKLGRLVKDAS